MMTLTAVSSDYWVIPVCVVVSCASHYEPPPVLTISHQNGLSLFAIGTIPVLVR